MPSPPTRPLSRRSCRHIITRQVASALAAAHDEGIVHRDLKPANVFLVKVKGEADFVKVLDFGISKIKASRTKLTRATSVMGTPDYMSPEQATGMVDEIDHHADQWALACIAWEMLSGRAPFVADDVSALFYQVINMDPHPLSKRVPGLPPEVEPVLRRALYKRPHHLHLRKTLITNRVPGYHRPRLPGGKRVGWIDLEDRAARTKHGAKRMHPAIGKKRSLAGT